MAYQRLLNLRIIMTFVLAALLVVAVSSCAGAAEPTSEPAALGPNGRGPHAGPCGSSVAATGHPCPHHSDQGRPPRERLPCRGPKPRRPPPL